MTKQEAEDLANLKLEGFGKVRVLGMKADRVHFVVRKDEGASGALVQQIIKAVIRDLPIGPRYTYLVV